ncbi:MAG: right-handed parallel beta-helix repeat-containing protein [Candidatus Omnitrophota bacterium]
MGTMGDALASATTASEISSFFIDELGYISVKRYGATGDGTTDDKSFLDTAAAALSDGDRMFFPNGTYLIAGENQYVTIDEDNVVIEGSGGAAIATENSTSLEVLTDPHYCGLAISGDNVTIRNLNFRGGLISVSTTGTITIEGCKFYNLHNAGIAFSSTVAFKKAVIKDCIFEYSLATDAGNYTSIQRGSEAADAWAETVIVKDCTFRGTSGGVNMHKTKHVIVDGCKFMGVDVNCVKQSVNNQKLTIINCEFDGAAIDAASANRHINAVSDYAIFCQVLYNVTIENNKFFNYSGLATIWLTDGSFMDGIVNIKHNTFDTCIAPFSLPQGNACIRDNKFENCGTASTGISICEAITWGRKIEFDHNYLLNTKVKIGSHGEYGHTYIYIRKNSIKYNLDNNGAIQIYNQGLGADNIVAYFVEDNEIEITDSKSYGIVCESLQPVYSRDNVVTGAAVAAELYTTNSRNKIVDDAITGANTLAANVYGDATTVINTSATGNIAYTLSASFPIGARVNVQMTHATRTLTFLVSGGTISGHATCVAGAQYTTALLVKETATTWGIYSQVGTWSYT